MLRYIFTTAFLVLYLTNSFSNSRPVPVDSVGIEKKNGKTFVLHKVEQGETLYSILRRYHSNENEFYSANPDFKKDGFLGSNQVISVPFNIKNKVAARTITIESQSVAQDTSRPRGVLDENGIEVIDIPEATPKDLPVITPNAEAAEKLDTEKASVAKLKTYKVVAGDKLFGIATKHNVKVWQLREWNKLTSDIIQINQVLIVEKPVGEAVVATVAKELAKPKTVVAPPTATTKPKPVAGPAGDGEPASRSGSTVVTKPLSTTPQTPVPNAPTGKKYSEQGIAEVIDAGGATNKYLALHRTAPVGTLIKISNDANGQSVWVKVIGKLSGSGDVIVKISPKAFEKLQPRDKRIRASLTYAL